MGLGWRGFNNQQPSTVYNLNLPTKTELTIHWDNVTGVGTPNAQAFADSFHP